VCRQLNVRILFPSDTLPYTTEFCKADLNPFDHNLTPQDIAVLILLS
jgi:hypothetical protein